MLCFVHVCVHVIMSSTCVFSLLSLGRFAELLVAFRNHIAEGKTKQSSLSVLQLSCAAYRGNPDVHYMEMWS